MKKRIQTIDYLRAITMLLMIFVNDFWTLKNIPDWLKHAPADFDGMGFSDVIFPLFLFIVGLSIPYAIEARINKGENSYNIFLHILKRSISLIVMGVLMVNYENANNEIMIISKYSWGLIMAFGIVLLWVNFSGLKISDFTKKLIRALGVILIIFLCLIYKGNHGTEITWMKFSWWGILGIIGWSYLLISSIYLVGKKNIKIIFIAFLLLLFLNIQEGEYYNLIPEFKIIVSSSNHILVSGGLLFSLLYFKNVYKLEKIKLFKIAFIISITLLVFGLFLRNDFPISKIYSTPSWSTICLSISIISCLSLDYILKFNDSLLKYIGFLKPAGTSTLMCYLIPYFVYPIITLLGFKWPELISNGGIGLLKSMIFSVSIIAFCGILEKRKLRLVV